MSAFGGKADVPDLRPVTSAFHPKRTRHGHESPHEEISDFVAVRVQKPKDPDSTTCGYLKVLKGSFKSLCEMYVGLGQS
jgi:hypothetical protein